MQEPASTEKRRSIHLCTHHRHRRALLQLKDEVDSALFEYYGSSELVQVDVAGGGPPKVIAPTRLYTEVDARWGATRCHSAPPAQPARGGGRGQSFLVPTNKPCGACWSCCIVRWKVSGPFSHR
jgi:hypothetical protein